MNRSHAALCAPGWGWALIALMLAAALLAARPAFGQEAPVDVNRPDATQALVWSRYAGSPVLDVTPGGWDAQAAGLATVIPAGSAYQAWYSGTNGSAPLQIGFAESQDGIAWQKMGGPVLAPGPAGAWDSGYVTAPHVHDDNELHRMWYRGTKDPTASVGAALGYAESSDGQTWVKHGGNPVFLPGPDGAWDSLAIWNASVLEIADEFRMWYSACDKPDRCRIGYATSPDGLNWTRYSGNPVLDVGPQGAWDSQYAYYAEVVPLDGGFEMWYTGYDGTVYRLGRATSPDGIHWTRDPANPILEPGPVGSWDSASVLSPSVVRANGIARLWYTGINNTGSRTGLLLGLPVQARLPLVIR